MQISQTLPVSSQTQTQPAARPALPAKSSGVIQVLPSDKAQTSVKRGAIPALKDFAVTGGISAAAVGVPLLLMNVGKSGIEGLLGGYIGLGAGAGAGLTGGIAGAVVAQTTDSKWKGALLGLAVGAASGAATGGAIGRSMNGAITGAALGAVGGVIGGFAGSFRAK